jgi:hypothetical protein
LTLPLIDWVQMDHRYDENGLIFQYIEALGFMVEDLFFTNLFGISSGFLLCLWSLLTLRAVVVARHIKCYYI